MSRDPQGTFLVCATPRSGSTLLCKSLSKTGRAGRPEEYFECLAHSGRPREPREYFEGVQDASLLELLPETEASSPDTEPVEAKVRRQFERSTTDNGVFGTKLMWGHLEDLALRLEQPVDAMPADLSRLFREPRYVFVTRADKVAQAVSLWKAVQTRSWNADTSQRAEPVYHEAGIHHLVRQLEEQDDAWRVWFASHGLEPFTVEYERLDRDHHAEVAAVLEQLDLGHVPAPDPPTRRQADERSDRWAQRYRKARGLERAA
jgi:trehalose 2-sulfotransferase